MIYSGSIKLLYCVVEFALFSTTKNPKQTVCACSEAKLLFCDPKDVGVCINYLATWIFYSQDMMFIHKILCGTYWIKTIL